MVIFTILPTWTREHTPAESWIPTFRNPTIFSIVMAKSTVPENGNYAADFLSQHDYLDHAFADSLCGSFVKTWWLSHEQLDLFSNLLNYDVSLDIHSISGN